jgi:hypothetical protein
MLKHLTATLLAGLTFSAAAFAGEGDKKVVVPPAAPDDSWQFKLSLPAWIPWLSGDVGLNGINSHISLAPDNIMPKLDMVVDVRAEAHKGRFSVMAEYLYLNLSDGVGTNTVVKKLDYRMDQTMADVSVGWRLIETERGNLDVLGGVRFNQFYQRMTTQPNDERIDQVVDTLASATGRRLRTAVARALVSFQGKDVTVPIAPLRGGDAESLARKIERIRGNRAERQAQIKKLLHNSLDSTVARTDTFWDPYVGLRGRYNLNSKFYLTARGDIGGFTVGSDLSWTAEAGIGCQLTRNAYTEITYRAFGIDYEKNGLLMDTVTHGPQVNIGIHF